MYCYHVRELLRFLSAAFRYPDRKSLVETLSEIALYLSFNAELPSDIRDKLFRVHSLYRTASLKDLQEEYTRLFISNYPSLPCPPYESVWREPGRTIMGESSLRIQEEYAKAGVKLSGAVKEPPDHLALELEFAAILPSDKSKEFVARHLAAWVDVFTDCVKKNSKLEAFSELAALLDKTIYLASSCKP